VRPPRLLIGVVALIAVTPAPAPAQEGDDSIAFSLRLANAGQRPNFLGDLQYNCTLFFARGVDGGGRGRWLYARGSGPAIGTLDAPNGTGEVFNRASDWQVEGLPPGPARPTVLADLGIALDGRSVYLTGRVGRGRARLSQAGRVRLARVRGARIDAGPLRRAGREVPNTYSTAVTGTLVMLPAMSRAIDRPRCRNRAQNPRSRRLPAGYVLGRFTAEFRPGRATGLEGTARVSVPVEGAAVQPSDSFVVPIIPGAPVPLSCALGQECLPSGGTVALASGFDLVRDDRRAAVTGLRLTTTGQVGAPYRTVTGVLDGNPVTIGEGEGYGGVSWTPDFTQRVSAALGAEVVGSITIAPDFTRLGP
jgi:hypothetical protein